MDDKIRKISEQVFNEKMKSPNALTVARHTHNGTDANWISVNNFRTLNTKYFSIATQTNGTTPVNVFTPNVPHNSFVTAVYIGALDATAGTITVTRTRNGVGAVTVATVAKGGTAGTMTLSTNLANTTLARGDQLTVVSSSAGNAIVIINYTL